MARGQVFLFMKGSPAAPQCGFSNTTVRILQHYNVSFGAADVLSDPDLREGIKQFSKWPTIPQVPQPHTPPNPRRDFSRSEIIC